MSAFIQYERISHGEYKNTYQKHEEKPLRQPVAIVDNKYSTKEKTATSAIKPKITKFVTIRLIIHLSHYSSKVVKIPKQLFSFLLSQHQSSKLYNTIEHVRFEIIFLMHMCILSTFRFFTKQRT